MSNSRADLFKDVKRVIYGLVSSHPVDMADCLSVRGQCSSLVLRCVEFKLVIVFIEF